MIISRTPFRISFLGGGSDLPSFYQDEEGAVLSTTINKYMYLTVNDRFDSTYRLSYSKTEIASSIEQIEHTIFKNVLQKYGSLAEAKNGGRGLEILSMADIPGGTGLGSSSTFTVGLLHAMKAHVGIFSPPKIWPQKRLASKSMNWVSQSANKISTQPLTAGCSSFAFTPRVKYPLIRSFATVA